MVLEHNRTTQFIKFLLSGGFTAVFLVVALEILVSYVGFKPVPASALAYILALLVNFTLQKFWSFNERHVSRMHVQMTQFAVVGIVNLGINTLCMHVLTNSLGIGYIAAQILIVPILALGSYAVYKSFIFRDSL